ncbi:inositol monophosphatase family protein [Promicromonospora sp. NPDC059942]|uniref:inositol monophosphatase family protein n=1 Tax=Promicromonospora sp. NPDC059942 TaxID=3347009 RepID=UPI003647BA14
MTTISTLSDANVNAVQDATLVPGIQAALAAAGAVLVQRFETKPEFLTRDDVVEGIYANDRASLDAMRPALTALRPEAGWAEDELESGALPDGEWWITDPVEGNINHIHGMADWGVTATLVRDNVPAVTVVHLPLTGDFYTAVRGGGAFLNGQRITPSVKTSLDAALVGSGQASPRETSDTFAKIARSTEAMLDAGLVLRLSVPATLQLIQVAAGRTDLFWQHSAVRSGLVSGALLVSEAGGVVSDLEGGPWTLDSTGFLATTHQLHAEAVSILAPHA